MFLNALPGQAWGLQTSVSSGAPWHPGSPSFPPSQDLNLRRPVEIFPPHVTGQPVQSPHSVHSEQIFDFWWIGYNFIIKNLVETKHSAPDDLNFISSILYTALSTVLGTFFRHLEYCLFMGITKGLTVKTICWRFITPIFWDSLI